jgi:ribosomal protein S27AE
MPSRVRRDTEHVDFTALQERWANLRRFRGEREATNFLDALQHLQDRPKDRVLEVLRFLQKAETLANRTQTRAHNRAAREALEKLIGNGGPLDRALAAYRVRPLIFSYAGTGELQIDFTAINEKRSDEFGAIYEAIELARMGLTRRLRECSNCGAWFFARFSHQSHCAGGKCRIAEYRKSEQWKEYRRKKSKEYYWLRKNTNVK